MAQITFWSPIVNQCGTTTTVVAVSSIMALDYDYKNLVLSTNYMDNTLESSFINITKQKARSAIDFTDMGVDALERLIKSGKLNVENVVDYTTPILKGRLDMMFGSQKKDKETYEKVLKLFPGIIECAKTSYDMVLVDVQSKTPDETTMKILEASDLIVVNINQSIEVLEEFFNVIAKTDLLKVKPYILVMGRYDRYSKYNSKNLSKYFKYKEHFFTIPYNTQFFDMKNEHKSIEFFIKYLNVVPSDRNGFFVNEIKSLTKKITEKVVISAEK